MDIDDLVNITSRAWALPILSKLHDGVPGRQAALLTATGASRTAFAQSLEHLTKLGLIERNPGHGHPLRPEFRLTVRGIRAAELANRVQGSVSDEGMIVLRRRWSLPVLTTLNRPTHFNQIKRSLRSITDRALSQSLQVMEDQNWVQRRVDVTLRPPRPLYSAVNAGEVISRIASAELSI